ncbi:MAG: phosphatidylglycerol lysyltransferase domain-containing protein [Defluviitaleaceae bacterium]|nr:phosphatidylglycerol lysyltransferase domain-containing protein [Defluviitaleaceae bacterium]
MTRPVTIDDKQRFEQCRNELCKRLGNYISDLCFSSVLAWSESLRTRCVFVGDFCCISVEFAGKWYQYAPLGSLEAYESFLEKMYPQEEIELIMVSEQLLAVLRGLKNYRVEYSYDAAYSDYLYENASFLNFLDNADNRYDYNHFVRNHAPDFRLINELNKADCVEVMDKYWCAGRDCGGCHFGCERKALQNALAYFTPLGLCGALVYAKNEPIAFCIATHLSPEVIAYSFLKAARGIRGLQMYLLASFACEAHREAARVNFSEDMGIEGLRSFKRRLAGFVLVCKYNVVLRRGNL